MVFLFLFVALLCGCSSDPEGIRLTPQGEGATVIANWTAKPLPDVPFPNDILTRPDVTTGTRLRVSIAGDFSTEHERQVIERLNEQNGFGVSSPISVSFDGSLDLENIIRRHRDDDKVGSEQYVDDAVFLICVEKTAPCYQKAIMIDVGQGRFPSDVADSTLYFPNDPRRESPSILFDTVNEDSNGNGSLDWGEDSDNDGVLDQPNVYPLDIDLNDPVALRANLLSWYERETDTLLLRPVFPLLQGTTYAVVLTDRLLDSNGHPVRSPWKWVHHLRQTEELSALEGALQSYDLSTDNVAFAWTFTTHSNGMDLLMVRRGIYGEGEFADIAAEVPAGIRAASVLHDKTDENPYVLPISDIFSALASTDVVPQDDIEFLSSRSEQSNGYLVGGAFASPNFLHSTIGGTGDFSSGYWNVNPTTGEYVVGTERVPFSCVMPDSDSGFEQPYPVVVFGHGYDSSRFDLVRRSWAFTPYGYAVCGIDFQGYGLVLDEEQESLWVPELEEQNISEFLRHFQDSRAFDVNNDGVLDSGGAQWTVDPFHSRDMIRQGVVDWIQMVKSFRACGDGTMIFADGTTGVSCDWDQDGVPDIGTEESGYFVFGESLGGLVSAVAAPLMPEVQAVASVASGAGLADMAVRTEREEVIAAVHGRLVGPLILGIPNEDGQIDIIQMVNSVTRMVSLPIARVDSLPANGVVVVENITTGDIREGWIPEDGAFRLGIAADALEPYEKRLLLGISDEGIQSGQVYSVPDNEGLGDRLRIEIRTEAGEVVYLFDSWASNVVHEGVTMPAGSPLVAGSDGYGLTLGTPTYRKMMELFSMALEAGDPLLYAPRYLWIPYSDLGREPSNILLMPSIGDTTIPISSGISLARAAGLVNQNVVDNRYGVPVDTWLAEKRVIQGLEEFGEHICTEVTGEEVETEFSCLFDPDNVDNSTDDWGAPSEAALRLQNGTWKGIYGLRIAYVDPQGSHGFGLPNSTMGFDVNAFAINQILQFFRSEGATLSDDACLATFSCEWMIAVSEEEE